MTRELTVEDLTHAWRVFSRVFVVLLLLTLVIGAAILLLTPNTPCDPANPTLGVDHRPSLACESQQQYR